MTRITDEEMALARKVCTGRQVQVLTWHRRGYGYRAIAELLGLAPGTVRDHVKAARRRMLDAQERLAA